LGNSADFNVRGGYRLTDYFALEELYECMDDFGKAITSRDKTKTAARVRPHTFSLLGKVTLPTLGITRLRSYLSAGAGFPNTYGLGKFTLLEPQGKDTPSHTAFTGRVMDGVALVLTPENSSDGDRGYVISMNHLCNLTSRSPSLGAQDNG